MRWYPCWKKKRREKVMSWKSFRVIMKVESSIKFRRHITMEQKGLSLIPERLPITAMPLEMPWVP